MIGTVNLCHLDGRKNQGVVQVWKLGIFPWNWKYLWRFSWFLANKNGKAHAAGITFVHVDSLTYFCRCTLYNLTTNCKVLPVPGLKFQSAILNK